MSNETAEIEDTDTVNETLGTTGFGDEGTGADVLDTPSLALPKKTPEVHEGVVVSVTTKVGKDTGNSYGVITLQSKNTGLTYDFGFFPPQAWFDPANWGTRGFDPNTLSDVPPPGKKQSPQQAFARSISASDAAYTKEGAIITEVVPGKDAPLQLLKKLAAIEGFTVEPGTPRPTNGTEYIEVINSLVAGRLDVLFTLRPQKDDTNPQFDGQLKVAAILPKTDVEKPNFDKRFANYRIMWQ